MLYEVVDEKGPQVKPWTFPYFIAAVWAGFTLSLLIA